MLEPHVVQDHKIPHGIVTIQATGGVGDLGHLLTVVHISLGGLTYQ